MASPPPNGLKCLAWFGLFLCLVIPSMAQVEKYAGVTGLLAHPLVAIAGLWGITRWRPQLTEREALILAAVTFALVGLAFAILFPLANSGVYGPGSDTDEAYDIAVRELFHGRYPYHQRTYLGNLIHHMPGSLVLAMPFVLLGSSAYQNLFWLLMFFLLAWKELRGACQALMLLWLLLALCPVILQQIVTGVDGVMSGISVLAGFSWLARERRPWGRIAAAALFTLALSNRLNFFLAIPQAWAWLARNDGRQEATRVIVLVCVLLAVVNVPFYLYDPEGFAPLEGFDRVTRFEGVLPHAGVILPGMAALVAVALSFYGRSLTASFANLAIVQGLLVIAGVVLACLRSGKLDLGYAGYGGFFLFSGALACWSFLLLENGWTTLGVIPAYSEAPPSQKS